MSFHNQLNSYQNPSGMDINDNEANTNKEDDALVIIKKIHNDFGIMMNNLHDINNSIQYIGSLKDDKNFRTALYYFFFSISFFTIFTNNNIIYNNTIN